MNNDLSIERNMDAPVGAVWRAWTEHLAEWWCPRPWTTELQELDLRAGGRFATVMRGPGGEEFGGESVFLEVVPERRVVFTNAIAPGWRPQSQPPLFIGVFEFEADGERTRYRASARHWRDEDKSNHEAMGFEAGWGAVATQLEEVAKRLA